MSTLGINPWPVEGRLGEWEQIKYYCGDSLSPYEALRDKSTGDLYLGDPGELVRYKALLSTASTPIHMLAMIALNLLRLALAPFYFALRALIDCCQSSPSPSRWDQWKECSQRSLINCVRDVFYGIACTFAGLYTILAPLNGKKLYAAYEFEWNRRVSVDQAIHVFSGRENFKAKDPFLHDHAYYIPGCFQPPWKAKETEETLADRLRETDIALATRQWAVYGAWTRLEKALNAFEIPETDPRNLPRISLFDRVNPHELRTEVISEFRKLQEPPKKANAYRALREKASKKMDTLLQALSVDAETTKAARSTYLDQTRMLSGLSRELNILRFLNSEDAEQCFLTPMYERGKEGEANCFIFSKKTRLNALLPTEGKIFGQGHWTEVSFTINQESGRGYLDESTGYLYAKKGLGESHLISLLCLPGTALHCVGAMLYNAFRIVPVALYILGGVAYEAWTGKEIYEDDPFKLSQIVDQIGFSLGNIVLSPFHALGVMFGLVWSLIDPLNGRKVAASFEREWNHGLHRKESYWSTLGAQKEFAFEGGGAPSKLGRHAFYLPGCYQPFGRGTVNDLKTMRGTSYSEVQVVDTQCTSWLPKDCCIKV